MRAVCAGWRYEGMLCESDVADTGAMWECPLLAPLRVVPESARARQLPRGDPGSPCSPCSLPSTAEEDGGSAFAASNGVAHAPEDASWPGVAGLDRRMRAGEAAARPAERQAGFSPPKAGVGLGRTTAIGNLAQAAGEPWGVDCGGGGGGDREGGSKAGEIEAMRAKSLLSEQLLNPYADEESSADGDATMWGFLHLHPVFP